MISRRLLRIKVLQVLYSYYQSEEKSINKSEKELFFSIEKSYDLYHYLILLMLDVVDYAQSRIDLAKKKRIPTHEDLNPNTRFVDNKLMRDIRENEDFLRYLNEKKLSWVNYPEIVKNLFQEIKDSDLYKEYMSAEKASYNDDKKFISRVFSDILILNESLHQTLEEQSIFWNDDVDFVVSMIIRTIKSFKVQNGSLNRLMPLFKDDDDREFVKSLFRKSVLNYQENEELVSKYIKNWDIERVAFLDIMIMTIAITEVVEFPSIPVKVTLDEYIEISKYYSTEKSSVFINGILDKIVNDLKNTGKINKIGRGLIGEV